MHGGGFSTGGLFQNEMAGGKSAGVCAEYISQERQAEKPV